MVFFHKAKQAAESLTSGFIEAYPATLESMSNRKSQEIRNKALKQLLERTIEMQQKEKLGLFGRIMFAHRFQRHLVAAGYSSTFIRQTMTEVLSKISFTT